MVVTAGLRDRLLVMHSPEIDRRETSARPASEDWARCTSGFAEIGVGRAQALFLLLADIYRAATAFVEMKIRTGPSGDATEYWGRQSRNLSPSWRNLGSPAMEYAYVAIPRLLRA